MKWLWTVLFVMGCLSPAQAALDTLPTPLGLTMGSKLPTVLVALGKLKAEVTKEEKQQPGVHGSPYTYTRVKATLPKGKIAKLKLAFYNNTLARAQFLARDMHSPIATAGLGKPTLESPAGRQFWWNREKLMAVSCQGAKNSVNSTPAAASAKGECEIFDMTFLVKTLGNRHQIEVQFQLLTQSTTEKIEALKKAAR
jgi:hypothetical protein